MTTPIRLLKKELSIQKKEDLLASDNNTSEVPCVTPLYNNNSIEQLFDKIEKSGVKITFGIQPHQIKRIEEEKGLNPDMRFSTYFWEMRGKEFGWHPFTLALHYFESLLNNVQNVQECDATTAQSTDEPMAQNNIKKELTECYVPVEKLGRSYDEMKEQGFIWSTEIGSWLELVSIPIK